MRKGIICFLLGIFCLSGIALSAQTGISDAAEKNGKTEQLYGFPVTQYYHLNITIPPDVLASQAKQDRVNVYIHNKIVDFEKTNHKPLSSLPKLEMEDRLKAFEKEAYSTLFPAPMEKAKNAPEEPEQKPAIIEK
jgi:hypothetical protein